MKMEDETNKPILKIGDKVRIKSKEWFDSQPKDKDGDIITPEGYLLYFFRSMQVYCGKVYTIESISTNDHLINFKEDNRSWESWMFDIVESAHEYKVGDKVRIKSKEWFASQYKSNREDIEPPEEYNRPFFDFMEQYCGNICTIKYIYSNNVIKFNENDEDWESWMFDLVDEDKIEVGDVIKSENEEEYIIISNPKYGSSYGGLNTRNYKYSRIPRTNNIILLEPCKYKNLIDTKVSYLHERARLLRDKLLKSKDLNVSNGTTSSNSSKFDLTKVIYKSRRII